ncbi:MAG: diphthamide synthesis protein [DPANN group archaeon]|nr:diphthamide synthesis protein [DPANN group archaeon]
MDYDLELEKVAAEIAKLKKKNPRVCLQLPDGLKLNSDKIVDELNALLKKKKLKAQIYIWAGSNFGACDIPVQLEKFGFDLLINFGHAVFRKA